MVEKTKRNLAFKKSLMVIAVSSSIVLGAISLSGCSISQPRSDELVASEFLTDSSLLQDVPGEPGKRYYEKEGVDWAQYHSVMVEDVAMNQDDYEDANGMSRRDRLMMGIYFQNAMRSAVQRKYVVTNRPDSGVLIIRASINAATSGSSLDAIKITSNDKYGSVVIEGEIVDAMTGEPLVGIIDRQSGKFMSAYSNWDDVAIAFDEWSDQLYGLLQSHMESRPVYQRTKPVIAKASAPVVSLPGVSNPVATSRPIDVNKQIGSAASDYEQQQYAEIIDELLISAGDDLKADRLTSPPGKNAMERYNQVLDMDPGNSHAQDGLNIIASRYLGWAETALTNGEENKSQMYLSRAKHVSSTSESIRYSIAQLDEKLSNTLSSDAMAIAQTDEMAIARAIAEEPPAMGIPAPKPVAMAPAAKVKPTASPKPQPKMAQQEVKTVAKTDKPKPSVIKTPKVTVPNVSVPSVPSISEKTSVVATSAAAMVPAVEIAATPAPVKKVEEFDPWKGADMGSAQLNSAKLRPFVLGLTTNGDRAKIVAATKSRLSKAGFDVIGEYSPYNKATIIIVTNQTLKSQAAKSELGGYGSAVRVSVTQAGSQIQIAYTNPFYTQNIYRMKGDLSGPANKLAKTLGQQKVYGSNKGITANDLKDWHYMFGMPYFDDQITLGKGSYSNLVSSIDKNLSSGKSGTKKVYRIDIPGKDETIFGVGISKGDGADRTVMGNIDVAGVKHSAHLPYEILVSGNKAYMLNGKFRIALSFPDLTMGQFMAISNAPDSTETTLKSLTIGAQLSSN